MNASQPARRPARRGNNTIEFALILPVLIAITAGIVDYGMFYNAQLGILAAVNAGARDGSFVDAEVALHASEPCSRARDTANAELAAQGVSGATVTAAMAWSGSAWLLEVNAQAPPVRIFGLVPTPNLHRARMVVRMEDQLWAAGCAAP